MYYAALTVRGSTADYQAVSLIGPILIGVHRRLNSRSALTLVPSVRQGQTTSALRAIEGGQPCAEILHSIAACRGALNGLMAEVLEEHVRDHLLVAQSKERANIANEFIDAIHSYLG